MNESTEKLIHNLLSDISWLEQGSRYERDICKNIYKALAIIEPNKTKLNGLISEYHLDERLQT